MLDSVPLPFQAILWPLFGGGLILSLNRLLPGWVRRLVALAAALASLGVIWSLNAGDVGRAEILWEPLNFFRMSLTFSPDGLSLLIGVAMAGAAAAMALGIRGQEPQTTIWHGVILLVLAGCLAATMAANLLALASASALIDLSLILLVLRSSSRTELDERLSLNLVVPGIASTLLIVTGALQMDAQLGHGSLLSQNLSEDTMLVIGVAGALRVLVFPFHARRLRVPETAAALLLPMGVGGYLLSRVQAAAPVLSGRPWLMAVALIGLLAGGLLALAGSALVRARHHDGASPGNWWIGLLVHQAAYLLAFVLLLAGSTPWSVVGMILALAILAIWWDTALVTEIPRSRSLEQIRAQIRSWWDRVRPSVASRLRVPGWRRDSRLVRTVQTLLPVTALASLAGIPFTLGARGRWPYYAAWLKRGDASLLLILISDTLLVAGLSAALGAILEYRDEHQRRPAAIVAMSALAIAIVLFGLAPGLFSGGLDLEPIETAGVSVWGLGLLYLLPWLLGAWLGRLKGFRQAQLARIWDTVNLNWLNRVAGWAGRRLVSGLHWLGHVGEGEGWWGWVLIILALGAVLFTVQ